MSTYPQRVADNILPLSVAGTLPEAFAEWYFTEAIADHLIAEETCQFCNQEDLRYHFEIKNRHTSHRLWVGSSCILKFRVNVYEAGSVLSPDRAKKKLDALQRQMRLDSCIRALNKLAVAENNEILRKALDFYLTHKFLTPRFAFVVFWRLSANKIDHSPSFFRISLKKDKYKLDLVHMPTDRVHVFWPALSSGQRKLAARYGHEAPE